MTDEVNNDAPENEDVEPEAQNVEAQEAEDTDEPDWRKDFDADKAHDRIRKLQSESKNLRERAKDAEKKAANVDDLTKERDNLSLDNLRLSVGYELGLPLALAKRLSGGNREELIADAEELVKIAGGGQRPRKPIEALRTGGEGDKEPEETDLNKIGSRMFRR